jgi:hypothetical protein
MKGHLKHLAMCSPMFVVAAILIAGGVNAFVAVLPVVGCMLMMGLMMWAMGHGHSGGRPET